MDIRKLQRAIVDGLEDMKAQHIAVFNTEHLSSMFERVIIASGTSSRQTKALAASVRDAVRSRGMQVMATEGEDNGEWIIVDCGAAVAHIMQPGIREYYHLEEIWGGKAVRMKVSEVNTKLVKASEPEPAPRRGSAASPQSAPRRGSASTVARAATQPLAQASPARKEAARKAAAKKATAKTGAQKAADKSAAFQRVAGRPPARKTAASKTVATKAVVAKPAARKPAAAKPVARKVTARKTVRKPGRSK